VKAGVYHAAHDIRVEDLPDPVPGPGDVLVELAACGVCGTDLMDWYTATKAPAVLGHEPVGVVVATGAAVDDRPLPAVGTRVFVHHHVPCFVCEQCRAGRHTLCPRFRMTALRPGGFAERLVAPAEHVAADVLAVPEHLSDDAATLIEPLACCIRGQRQAGVGTGTRLLVIGLGQIGLLQLQAGRAAGAAPITGVDPLPDRRARAEALGFATVPPEDVTALDPRPTVALVCTSSQSAVASALAAVAPGGVVQLFAPAAPGKPYPIDSADLFFREVTIQFTYSAGPFDTRDALGLLSAGMVTETAIVTHHYPLDAIGDAMAMARTPDAVRVVVTGPAYR
jgi:L-iditol 2-dehydrogenase